jgi:hypothetical protein
MQFDYYDIIVGIWILLLEYYMFGLFSLHVDLFTMFYLHEEGQDEMQRIFRY